MLSALPEGQTSLTRFSKRHLHPANRAIDYVYRKSKSRNLVLQADAIKFPLCRRTPEAICQRCLNQLPHSVKLSPFPAWKRVGDNTNLHGAFPTHLRRCAFPPSPQPAASFPNQSTEPMPSAPSQSRRLGCLGQLGRAVRVQLSYRKRNTQRHMALFKSVSPAPASVSKPI